MKCLRNSQRIFEAVFICRHVIGRQILLTNAPFVILSVETQGREKMKKKLETRKRRNKTQLKHVYYARNVGVEELSLTN